jgi:hypothetical protein
MPHQATREIVAVELAAGTWRHDESAVPRTTARESDVNAYTMWARNRRCGLPSRSTATVCALPSESSGVDPRFGEMRVCA